MKTLYVNGETYQAEKIIRTNTDILGFNSTGQIPIFAFRQIKDWTQFQLAEGQVFDTDLSPEARIQALEEALLMLLLL